MEYLTLKQIKDYQDKRLNRVKETYYFLKGTNNILRIDQHGLDLYKKYIAKNSVGYVPHPNILYIPVGVDVNIRHLENIKKYGLLDRHYLLLKRNLKLKIADKKAELESLNQDKKLVQNDWVFDDAMNECMQDLDSLEYRLAKYNTK